MTGLKPKILIQLILTFCFMLFFGVAVQAAQTDTLAPNWPSDSKVTAEIVTHESIRISWSAASDNVGVKSYKIFMDNSLLGSTNGIFYDVSSLKSGTVYNFKVEAVDEQGNCSTNGPSLSVTTAREGAGGTDTSATVGYDITADGKIDLTKAASVTTNTDSGKSETNIYIVDHLAQWALDQKPSLKTVVVKVEQSADVTTVKFSKMFFNELAVKNMQLEIITNTCALAVSPAEINISDAAEALNTSSSDFDIHIVLSKTDSNTLSKIQGHLLKEGLKQITVPQDVFIQLVSDNSKLVIKQYHKYLDYKIPLQGLVDPTSTGGMQVNSDGTLTPVATVFQTDDNKSVAVLKIRQGGSFTVVEHRKTYADLKNHWAKKEIETLASKSIVTGMSTNVFAPWRKITRREFTGFIVKAIGSPMQNGDKNFKDVYYGQLYTDGIGAATKAGIIDGYEDGTFRPEASITREEMAAIIFRVMGIVGLDVNIADDEINNYLKQFNDYSTISPWAKKYVAVAVKNGILKGFDNGYFMPAGNTTRAEASVMIMRLMQKAGFVE